MNAIGEALGCLFAGFWVACLVLAMIAWEVVLPVIGLMWICGWLD